MTTEEFKNDLKTKIEAFYPGCKITIESDSLHIDFETVCITEEFRDQLGDILREAGLLVEA